LILLKLEKCVNASYSTTQQTHIDGIVPLWVKQSVGKMRKQDCFR